MNEIKVSSKTQKIIVSANKSVSVLPVRKTVTIVDSGPVGPRGLPGPPGSAGSQDVASQGIQVIPSLTWIMDHNLGYMPAAFRFFDNSGQEFEPAEITYINENRLVAQWPELMSGSWFLS